MKYVHKNNKQCTIAGFVGAVIPKTENLYIVSIVNRFGPNDKDTELLHIAFSNPKKGRKTGNRFAELAKYIEVGQFATVIANIKRNGDYENYEADRVEVGSRKSKT